MKTHPDFQNLCDQLNNLFETGYTLRHVYVNNKEITHPVDRSHIECNTRAECHEITKWDIKDTPPNTIALLFTLPNNIKIKYIFIKK